MLFKQSRLPFLVLAICMGLGSLPTYAQNVSYPSRPKVIAFSRAENVRSLYVAVIGEVHKPGTFHLDPSTLNLHAVIRRAGGLTVDATHAIHVVRQGKISHQERFSETQNSPLQPGDLLIVESSQSKSTTGTVTEFDRDASTIHAGFEQPAPPAGVQVALLNVLDYPLVVTMRPDEAFVGQIVDQLGQGPEILPHLRVVSSDASMRFLPDQNKAAIHLTGGSAIVFEKGIVNRNRLPNGLPKPIESDIAQGAQSSLIGRPSGQSAELHSLGEKAFLSSSGTHEWHSLTSRQPAQEAVQPAPTELKLPTEEVKSDMQQPVLRLRPRIATMPSFTGDPPIANSSTRHPEPDRSPQVPIPQPDDSIGDDASSSSSPMIAPSLTIDDDVVNQIKPAKSAMPLVILFSVLLVMVGAAVMLRRQSQVIPVASSQASPAVMSDVVQQATVIEPTPAIAPLTSKSKLEQLIKNELPITFEVVSFPAGLELQGRLVPKPILRVDDSQNVVKQNGPHFGLTEPESGGYSLQEVIAQLDSAEPDTVRRPHFMGSKPQEVVTASIPAAMSSGPIAEGERPHAPLAKALFELEQGGRS
ncbi:polysaccharide biosynthesis/export family protein [Schlesneria paludicola]|uniref:hypothetical protein n=1 Tax=Schlesneria paludicola TaxID=360056 RepID=UPI000299EF95|nr:hypothetical protein [Schlesneria paludicola]